MLHVRPMIADDIPACMQIINHIITLGGSTAHEDMFTESTLRAEYFEDPALVNVVLDKGRVCGFQAVFEVEPGVYSIGSFTDQKTPVKGAGRALAKQMIKDCRAAGGTTIYAKITEDNLGGLAFYESVGFEDFKVLEKDHQRPDGRWVNRVWKRLLL